MGTQEPQEKGRYEAMDMSKYGVHPIDRNGEFTIYSVVEVQIEGAGKVVELGEVQHDR